MHCIAFRCIQDTLSSGKLALVLGRVRARAKVFCIQSSSRKISHIFAFPVHRRSTFCGWLSITLVHYHATSFKFNTFCRCDRIILNIDFSKKACAVDFMLDRRIFVRWFTVTPMPYDVGLK